MWEDAELVYEIQRQLLTQEEVSTTIMGVLEQQLCPLGEGITTNFTVPLSPAFVQRTWSTTAFQLTSGQSVVVMDPENQTVYKNPLHGRAKERLLSLSMARLQLSQASFPTGQVTKGKNLVFFTFPALEPPLSRMEAKKIILPFVEQVVAAVQELHDAGLAHRDIRLENICCHCKGKAVLIDLDRSGPIDDIADKATCKVKLTKPDLGSIANFTLCFTR